MGCRGNGAPETLTCTTRRSTCPKMPPNTAILLQQLCPRVASNCPRSGQLPRTLGTQNAVVCVCPTPPRLGAALSNEEREYARVASNDRDVMDAAHGCAPCAGLCGPVREGCGTQVTTPHLSDNTVNHAHHVYVLSSSASRFLPEHYLWLLLRADSQSNPISRRGFPSRRGDTSAARKPGNVAPDAVDSLSASAIGLCHCRWCHASAHPHRCARSSYSSAVARERFQTTASVMSQRQCPNIVRA